jgi:hypothetical protein
MRLGAAFLVRVMLLASCGSSSREPPRTAVGDVPTYITGVVIDAHDRPAPYAKVTVTLTSTVSVGVTEEAGTYAIRGIEIANDSSADVTAELDGHRGSTSVAPLRPGKNAAPRIKLAQ